MLYTILLVLLIIDSFVLILAVLMQSGQGGGIAASFGGVSSSTSSWLGARQTGNLLTKASWWSGAIFLALAFILSLASTRSRTPSSVLDQAFPNAPATAPAPAPNSGAANPAVPLQPAPAQGSGAAKPGATPPATKKP